MALVLRFFVQPRDRIQLEQIGELYQTLPLSDERKVLVRDTCTN
jgi:hypothetical protein